jgi:hypothetical protein
MLAIISISLGGISKEEREKKQASTQAQDLTQES